MTTITVLDKGYVARVNTLPTENLDLAVINAARVSYKQDATIWTDREAKLLRYLYEHKHTSPFEHVVFKFEVKAPIMVWWQWTRHRTMSYNLQSGRYMPYSEEEYYIPSAWRLQDTKNKQGSAGYLDLNASAALDTQFEDHLKMSFARYNIALSYGVAREQARIFLPAFALYQTGIVTVNAHNLMHFLRLRMAQDSQYEIRMYAHAVYDLLLEAMPNTGELLREELYGE